ncbi:MAG: c-type cytochrome [Elusimicrobia bacterium]|nr:c-type cytochrome [Elusimicrobiota bacterium]
MFLRRVLFGLPAAALLALPAAAERDLSVEAAIARVKRALTFHRVTDASPSEIALGRRLFFDRRLSVNGKMSCADCHRASRHFGDGLPRALGRDGKPVARNTPSLLNAAYYSDLFWDGRAATIEEASLTALQNPREMAQPLPPVIKRLAGIPVYASAFAGVYPGTGVSSTTLGRALGAYVLTVASREDSAFDRFILEDVPLSTSALSGFLVFVHKANCANCHNSRNLAYPQRYQNIGLAPQGAEDLGRYAVDPQPGMRGAFRSTVLRNVELTAPYMHDGRFATLAEVIDFYDRGGDGTRFQSSEIKPLHLTVQEKADLTAFLLSMTSSRGPEETP